jgi:hypothetical protein
MIWSHVQLFSAGALASASCTQLPFLPAPALWQCRHQLLCLPRHSSWSPSLRQQRVIHARYVIYITCQAPMECIWFSRSKLQVRGWAAGQVVFKHLSAATYQGHVHHAAGLPYQLCFGKHQPCSTRRFDENC